MSIDVGLRHRIDEIPGSSAWSVSAGVVSLTALEDGEMYHWPEPHLFMMHEATGHIMIDGSLGTFCHSWPEWTRAKGQSLASFLIRLDFDYFMRKAAKQPWTEVDVRASLASLKAETLRDRRRGYTDKKDAREIWNDLGDLSADMTEGELIHHMSESTALYDAYVRDGGPSLVRRDVTTARRFWDEVWASFRTHVLMPMAAREQPVPMAA